MNKGLIFALGVVVGAAAGTGITLAVVKKKVNEALQETKPSMDKDFYIEGLKSLGLTIYDTSEDDIPEEYEKYVEEYSGTRVNPLNDDVEEEEDEDDEEIEEVPAPIDPNPFPYIIESREFDNHDDFSTSTIHYYKKDETYTDDDYDIIDNIADILSDVVEKKLSEDDSVEAVYVRNEVQMCDYEVLIFNDSYKHVVEGEDELGDMAD